MKNTQTLVIEKIKNSYVPKERTKFDELKELNKKVKRPATVMAYTRGTAGSLVLGTGMCLAMKIIGGATSFLMPVGIGVGLLGIAIVSSTYAVYKKVLNKRKAKYSNEIIELSNELLNK